MDKFYVYGLLDPRKRGHFCYQDLPLSFLFEPFYIGKGQTKRAYAHFSEKIEKTKNSFKINKINKILKETGKNPFIIKIIENLDNKKALEAEILFIKNIGRGKMGPLTNLTEGGEGMIGYKHTEKGKRLIIESNKRRVVSKDTRVKISMGVKLSGFRPTPEMRENQRKRVTGNKNFFYGKKFCGPDNYMYGKHIGEKQRALLREYAKSRTGLKNPNIRYSYCLYNSETKEQLHNIFDVSTIVGNKVRLSLKSAHVCRFKKWVLVRKVKENIKNCACKDILIHNICDIPMGKKSLKHEERTTL
jgi:hypothetical protein